MSSTSDIVLFTFNAKYMHASFGLRCLRSNLGAYRERCTLVEQTLTERPVDAAERILALKPRIVGISVYIWNAPLCAELVSILKQIAPQVVVVLGGPEVSYECEAQPMCAQADFVVKGEGEVAFQRLCGWVLDAAGDPPARLISGPMPDLNQMTLPYDEYTDKDIAARLVYVEASRGCPFSCEFCLSSLDEKVRRFPLASFLEAMQRLYDRGLRSFKFVDRTFNLDLNTSAAILRFFLEKARVDAELFVHFEMIPDRLPAGLRELIAAFPPGVLQFEVGVQSFNPEVCRLLSRRQDFVKMADNFTFLHTQSGVHVHADLIVGLPGESLESFGLGFDRLAAMGPHEIQVGILKRLRGTPIIRHTESHQMIYANRPPYEVLSTRDMSFVELQRMRRFARFYDLVVNNGRFPNAAKLLLARRASPFESFLELSDWLYERTQATAGIALDRLALLLYEANPGEQMLSALHQDLGASLPDRLRAMLLPNRQAEQKRALVAAARATHRSRQARHDAKKNLS